MLMGTSHNSAGMGIGDIAHSAQQMVVEIEFYLGALALDDFENLKKSSQTLLLMLA